MDTGLTTENTTPRTNEAAPATLELIERVNAWFAEYEDELNRQSTKKNAASERRMRALLRSFNREIYVPYRDSTLDRN